jgi:arylsulfatase A-like enzyme
LDFLKKIGIYDQSVIVFLSDHGEEFYEHRGWFHGHSLYNEITKIPLFIKFSGNAFAGRTIASPVGIVDVLPTLLDSLGLFCPKRIDGVSLLPLIRQPQRQLRETLLVSCTQQFKENLPVKFALLFQHYKLIYNFPYSERNLKYYAPMGLPPWPGKIELYNLLSDPRETNNLYPAQKKSVAWLQPLLAEILRKIFALPKDKRGFQQNLQLEEREELKTLGYL